MKIRLAAFAALLVVSAAYADDDKKSATQACEKHFENFIAKPGAMKFSSLGNVKVLPLAGGNFQVAGPISALTNGQNKSGHYTCEAKRVGGKVWGTKLQIAVDP